MLIIVEANISTSEAIQAISSTDTYYTPDNVVTLDSTVEIISTSNSTGSLVPGTGDDIVNDDGSWNWEAFPKLATQTSTQLEVSVPTTIFKVSGFDFSNCFYSGDWLAPGHGKSQGTITLYRVPAAQLNPYNPTGVFKRGAPIEWRHQWGTIDRLICKAYILQPPIYKKEAEGLCSLELSIGDILLLKEDEAAKLPVVLCESEPQTASELAKRYGNYYGIELAPPFSYKIYDPPSDYRSETPFALLAALSEPENYDTRTSEEGAVTFVKRGVNSNTHNLTSEQVLDLTPTRQGQEPFTDSTFYNTFSKSSGFPVTTKQWRVYSGEWKETNHHPWFISNSTYTDFEAKYIGDTLIEQREKTYGWHPTTSTIPKEENDADACSTIITVGGGTSFGIIQDTLWQLVYDPHASGTWIVIGSVKYTEGKRNYDNGTDWVIYTGELEREIEAIENTAQEDISVCPWYWINLKTKVRKYKKQRRLLAQGYTGTTYYVSEWSEQIWYPVTGETATVVPIGDQYAEGTKWESKIITYTNNSEHRLWSSKIDFDPPSNSDFVRPVVVDVSVSAKVNLNTLNTYFGYRTSPSIQVPYCYDLEHLKTYGDRWLKEQAGVSDSLTLVVPYHSAVKLNDIITFTDWDGQVYKGLVISLEINQTQNVATQTVVLMRLYSSTSAG